MCGFVGFWSSRGDSDFSGDLRRMLQTLYHRGPDSDGVFEDKPAHFFLGHRRLSIIDLSPAGAQPMKSASGRFVLALNGEIYNFKEIRAELGQIGVQFRGNSDTEVLLAAIELWGLEEALKRSVGMFALALWDQRERQLYLARDRAGEKPLYYGWVTPRIFAFASELKAIAAHSKFESKIDRVAVSELTQFSYISEPRSIDQNFKKLMPGAYLKLGEFEYQRNLQPKSYWLLKEKVNEGRLHPFEGSFEEAVDELDRRLGSIIQNQMISDVPLGAFLSGGIDSSLVVAKMQQISNRPIKTFTIGFADKNFDESKSAEAVARAIGTDHTCLEVSPREAMDLIPRVPQIYDEPFADSSQIPTYFVAQLARKSVTVSLSGDGGDEVFGGYNRYFLGGRIASRLNRIPFWLRRGLSAGLRGVSPGTWDQIFGIAMRLNRGREIMRTPGLKMQKISYALDTKNSFELYEVLASLWPQAHQALAFSEKSDRDSYVKDRLHEEGEFSEFMMQYDFLTYLVDDILVKVDRAGMAVSLESRIPFLDHRLIEWAWTLPLQFKVKQGRGKIILKKLLSRYLSPELFERPKMGFGIPLASWLRGPLRGWAEDLLSSRRVQEEGFFELSQIQNKWNEHISGRRDWSHALWNVLMFQSWMDEQKKILKLKSQIGSPESHRRFELVEPAKV